jgi:DNA processing protein
MSASLINEIALTQVTGIGNVLFKQLISYFGSADTVFKTPKGKLQKVPGIGEKLAQNLLERKNPKGEDVFKIAARQIEYLDKNAGQVLYYTSPNYPQRLKVFSDAPVILYFQGSADLNNTKTVGIVGTRNATDYGKKAAEQIVAQLQKHQALIISGLALGIDGAAHKAAVQYSLPTVGVMACGLKHIYPFQHQKLVQQMMLQGGILTEYLADVKPDAMRFPERNRVIAALSDVVIVVETAKQGGTMITVEYAIDYNKPVLAVPNQINVKTSEGCHELIRQNKAQIYTSLQDIEEAANWVQEQVLYNFPKNIESMPLPTKSPTHVNFSAEEQQIVDLFAKQAELHIDEITWKTQLNINQVALILLDFEFRNLIKVLPGKKFKWCVA